MSDAMEQSPRCYFAVYADPHVGTHVTIEGGRFGNRNMPKNMAPGDMVLIYCTASYPGHEKSVPGMGIVTAVDHEAHTYKYDWMPFEQAVPLEFLRFAVTDADKERLANIRRDFLFQISRESFAAITGATKLRAKGPR